MSTDRGLIKHFVLVEFEQEKFQLTHNCDTDEAAIAAVLVHQLAIDCINGDVSEEFDGGIPRNRDKADDL